MSYGLMSQHLNENIASQFPEVWVKGDNDHCCVPSDSSDFPAASVVKRDFPRKWAATNLFLRAGAGQDTALFPEAGGDDSGHDRRVWRVLHLRRREKRVCKNQEAVFTGREGSLTWQHKELWKYECISTGKPVLALEHLVSGKQGVVRINLIVMLKTYCIAQTAWSATMLLCHLQSYLTVTN